MANTALGNCFMMWFVCTTVVSHVNVCWDFFLFLITNVEMIGVMMVCILSIMT